MTERHGEIARSEAVSGKPYRYQLIHRASQIFVVVVFVLTIFNGKVTQPTMACPVDVFERRDSYEFIDRNNV